MTWDTEILQIHMKWDSSGSVEYVLAAADEVRSPGFDIDLRLMAPSGPFFMCKALWQIRVAYGLDLCSQVLDISEGRGFAPRSVNPALESARLRYAFSLSRNLAFMYYPKPEVLIVGNAHLEDGTRQLVANHYFSVLQRIHEFHRYTVNTVALALIGSYYDCLEDQLFRGKIGRNRDNWSMEFGKWSDAALRWAADQFSYGDLPPAKDVSWRTLQHQIIQTQCEELRSRDKRISKAMGV